MSIIKGDFLGFTFDDVHSSELGITRISDGSRYTENLLPTIQDKTIQVPGSDGTYYHGSFYTQKAFNFPIAFDSLTEEQLRKIKVLFADKKIHNLIFDELPYKIYKVKTVGTPNLKYICFNEKDKYRERYDDFNFSSMTKEDLYGIGMSSINNRIYKGEGQLSFIAYNPYAKSRFKYINEYNAKNIPEWRMSNISDRNSIYDNLYDWVDSTRMINSNSSKTINNIKYKIDEVQSSGVLVYNAGDVDTDFILKIKFSNSFNGLILGNVNEKYLELNKFNLFSGDAGIQINTKLNLVEGINSDGNITGTLYNKFLKNGDFFKIKITETPELIPFIWTDGAPQNFEGSIEYVYLYY